MAFEWHRFDKELLCVISIYRSRRWVDELYSHTRRIFREARMPMKCECGRKVSFIWKTTIYYIHTYMHAKSGTPDAQITAKHFSFAKWCLEALRDYWMTGGTWPSYIRWINLTNGTMRERAKFISQAFARSMLYFRT